MSLTLLEQLMAKSETTIKQVEDAQAELKNEEPLTEFIGVNAPENTQDLAPELVEQIEDVASTPLIEQVEEMEVAFEQQETKGISIPMHDDGLEDEPPRLTSSHTKKPASASDITSSAVKDFVQGIQKDEEVEDTPTAPFKEESWGEIEEPTLDSEEYEESEEMSALSNEEVNEQVESDIWNEKPFSSRYFNFGGRTVNSLTRAGYTCFNDIEGMAYKELLDLKGFGRNCLKELLEILDIEDVQGWLTKRKKKVKVTEPVQEVVQESVIEVQEVVQESVIDQELVDMVHVVEEIEVTPQQTEEVVVEDTPEESNEVQEDNTLSVSTLKFLVIGNATPLNNNAKVASFEQVYAQAIQGICSSANVPSLGMVEYGKGWSALAATVRQNGWPANVDVLCVSKSFLSRFEILLELRSLADVVIEG